MVKLSTYQQWVTELDNWKFKRKKTKQKEKRKYLGENDNKLCDTIF